MRSAACLAICMVLAACGSPSGQPADPPVQTEAEALDADATELAKSLEVTPAEAARRLRAQAALGDHLARLRDVHRDRLAGIYYQNHPDFRVVVRLEGDQPVGEHVLNRSPVDGVPIEFRTGAEMSLDELQSARDRHADALRAIPGLQGYGVDERTGTIALGVYAPGREGEVGGMIADLQQCLQVPLTVEFLPTSVALQDAPGVRSR